MTREFTAAPCSGVSVQVAKGQTVTVIDTEGGQVADFFAEVSGNADEFLSPGVTIDCNASLRLKAGDIIYSSLYRPLFTVVADDVGVHDLLHPCCRPEMYEFFYGNGKGHPNCLANINACLGESRPIIRPVNLFMNTEINSDGSINVLPPVSKAGDKITLRAEADVRVCVAACSVSESDCNSRRCTSVGIVVSD